ncbi:uncharacterized protein VP01_5230g1 [Puccinia sorghi]|uniref:Uncharacterized protein n=1 Tax=Puccinia sorghi TaxID=27349 RepID=A0A0L6ULC3_9BASI|nr:uncharacterized protein VP01_5230g1 [Puccinia sorghi]
MLLLPLKHPPLFAITHHLTCPSPPPHRPPICFHPLPATQSLLLPTPGRFACLDVTAGQQNPTPAPTSNPMVLAKPQPFNGTRSAAAEAFVGQIGLHAVTYPKQFPTDASKVVLAVSFMRNYTETWSQTWPCGTSARLELCWPTHRTSTSTPTPCVGLTPHS